MSPRYSWIYGFRDRPVERLRRSLETVRQQTVKDQEVVVLDYGSSREGAAELQEHLSEFPEVKLVRTETEGWPWNRGRALNTGVREASGDYLLFADIDLLFAPSFVEEMETEVAPGRVLHREVEALPKGWEKKSGDPFALGELPSMSKDALGAPHLIHREVFEALGGFDEAYEFWGLEDWDLHEREIQSGLEPVWLTGKGRVLHQWHAVHNYLSPGFHPDGYWMTMENYLRLRRGQLQRNPGGWGQRIAREDRPLLQKLGESGGRIPEEAVRFRTDPRHNPAIADFQRAFDRLPPGGILAVGRAGYPRTYPWLTKGLNKVNALLLRVGVQTGLGYARGPLRENLYTFAQERKEELDDFHLSPPRDPDWVLFLKAGGAREEAS